MRLKLYICTLLLPAIICIAAGCKHSSSTNEEISRTTDWSVTLNHESKTPYGAAIAFETLPCYFPQARIETLNKWFHYNNITSEMRDHSYDSTSMLIVAGLNFYVSEKEWTSLKSYMHEGNEIVLFCSTVDNIIENDIHCKKESTWAETQQLSRDYTGERNQGILHLQGSDKSYGYTGHSIEGDFDIGIPSDQEAGIKDADTTPQIDSIITEPAYGNDETTTTTSQDDDYTFSKPEILGTVGKMGIHPSRPDFIRYKYGKGHLTIHAAPLTLSNYFLLQPGNQAYMSGIWHTLPNNVGRIYWNDFYSRTRGDGDSGMKTLWQYTATRMGMLILLVLLLLYVIFESKRRQRIIPIIPPLTNSSVAFVETVGRLYFHQGNHRNLAGKMVQHFLEWVRTTLYLDTNKIDSEFARQLQVKSGMPAAKVQEMIHIIKEVRGGIGSLPDEYLQRVHTLTQSFYDQKK